MTNDSLFVRSAFVAFCFSQTFEVSICKRLSKELICNLKYRSKGKQVKNNFLRYDLHKYLIKKKFYYKMANAGVELENSRNGGGLQIKFRNTKYKENLEIYIYIYSLLRCRFCRRAASAAPCSWCGMPPPDAPPQAPASSEKALPRPPPRPSPRNRGAAAPAPRRPPRA